MKTSELTGPALDWAVAKAARHVLDCDEGSDISGLAMKQWNWAPSTNWSQGGPIIEWEWLCVDRLLNGAWMAAKRTNDGDSMLFSQSGPHPLIAAMRCFVASKLGDEVGVPKELE